METKLFKWGPLSSATVTTKWEIINIIFMVTVSVWLLPRLTDPQSSSPSHAAALRIPVMQMTDNQAKLQNHVLTSLPWKRPSLHWFLNGGNGLSVSVWTISNPSTASLSSFQTSMFFCHSQNSLTKIYSKYSRNICLSIVSLTCFTYLHYCEGVKSHLYFI